MSLLATMVPPYIPVLLAAVLFSLLYIFHLQLVTQESVRTEPEV